LEAACAGGRVRTRVKALLKAHDSAGDFLEGPAVQPAPTAETKDDRAGESGCTSAHEALDFLAPCDTPGRLGLLAHYEILEILGRGGMGVVLRGVDVKLHRAVAIKVLAPQLAANAMARQRFLREAQAAAAVSHDHLVAIHDVDECNGLPYLVMECVSGPSLQQKIDAGGALSLAQILRIGMQIASGLAAAHAHGLVHRDIKPANILLENHIERVKITDFGLARSIDDVRITQDGAVYGTPQYMSPEQAQGERVDQRSDLFSLGSVLYATCTGRSPFRGDTGLSVLKRVCEDTPRPIREVNPDIPEALVEIVNRLLAKNPGARFQSAAEVAEVLSRYLAHLQQNPLTPFQAEPRIREDRGEQGVQPRHGGTRSGLRWTLLLGAAVFMGIAVLAAIEGARLTNWTGLAAPRVASARQEVDPDPPTRLATPRRSTTHPPGAADRPVKVFILAGDYNMAGRAKVELLKYQANQAATKQLFQHLLRDDKWVVRDDVWIKNFKQKGNLTVGFGSFSDRFGPELEFGHVVGDYFDEQVLLIKTCCGDSLWREFLPPGSALPPQEVLERQLRDLQKTQACATLADVQRRYGAAYREMVKEVRDTLTNLGTHFPSYQGQGFQLMGFVWFQGWNDIAGGDYDPLYAEHLAQFIRDVRRDFRTPQLPFVIGQLGARGVNGIDTNDLNIRGAQAGVAQLAEFRNNVKLVATDPYWDHKALAVYKKGLREHRDEWDKVGSDAPYRYLGSARTFSAIGKAFGEAMIELCRSNARN
jgi:serine/threonine protein kinase